MSSQRLRVLFAPDSFKGSISSVAVAEALAEGWRSVRPDDEITLAPLADGGEGTLAAIVASGGWTWRESASHDPIGRPVEARWLRSADGSAAMVELAEASGLSRLTPAERDPLGADTGGTGEVIRAVLDEGIRRIAIGIGGSATNDGGTGILRELGVRDDGAAVDVSGIDGRLANVDVEVACDVTNPLLGPSGAAATYGPQKGATPSQVEELDRRLAAWADRLESATSRQERDTPGAGAAGGVGFAFLCLQDRFRSFALRPGIELVMEAASFDDKLASADVVITGEGRIDAQTAFGKTALGVARRAGASGVRCIAVGGSVEPEGSAALATVGATAEPVWERPVPLDEAIAAGSDPLVRCGARLATAINVVDLADGRS